jgi:toxin CcdB
MTATNSISQFDVVANPFPHSRDRQPYLVTLQSELLTQALDTIMVAPLEPKGSATFADQLNPEIEIDGQQFVLIAQEIVTVRKSLLGKSRASIAKDRDKVAAALDLAFTGF